MDIFVLAYWLGMIGQVIIRAPYSRQWKAAAKAEQRVSVADRLALGVLALGSFVVPLIYSLTHWLVFADYHLPTWLGWVGVLLLIVALYLFWRSHHDLKSNWSPSLEIFQAHTLITDGIYSRIRHPMYASQWVWVLAQALLLQNGLAGPLGVLTFAIFYFMRVQGEEKMMLEKFGQTYRDYIQKTGAVIPKL